LQHQEVIVRQFVRLFFGSSKNINAAPTELPDHGTGNVDISVEADRRTRRTGLLVTPGDRP
jgi:hypothetical protein